MLPSEKAFSAAVSALGIYNRDGIVVYDGKGLLLLVFGGKLSFFTDLCKQLLGWI
jgi:hypothetical protein